MHVYVDAYIAPIPKKSLDAYRKLAELSRAVWLEHGALSYREWMANDTAVGKLTSFPRSVLLKEDEVVIFAVVEYASREARDEVNRKVFADPRMDSMMVEGECPFDGKRLIWGGFEPFIG
ncbi:MAG: DUF1428 family protein [Zetaproteobacteria bacterium]|nr:DUF1428 family protein [Zetaproteobacteria bacterium]